MKVEMRVLKRKKRKEMARKEEKEEIEKGERFEADIEGKYSETETGLKKGN